MRKDPQKAVLLIAFVVMLVSVSIFALLAINLFQQFAINQNPRQASAYETAPAQSSLTEGTVDLHPTFLPPGSTPINTTSSQPPKNGTPTFAVPTITITPTTAPTVQPTITPTPSSTNGIFTIQIISYPTQTNNNTVVPIQVSTGQPNAILQLSAIYTISPYFYQISNQVTDPGGNATIYWSINIYGSIDIHGTNSTTARFSVTGTTPNGQVATSSMKSLQVILHSVG